MPKTSFPSPANSEAIFKLPPTIDDSSKIINEKGESFREKNAERIGKLYTSDLGSFTHIVKSSLGSGFLAVPSAFRNIGLLMGAICIGLVALITAHCTHILVKSSQELCFLRGKSSMSYAETVDSAFLFGAKQRLAKWSRFMRFVTNFFMFLTYYGVNTIYVILIADSIKEVMENHLSYSLNIRWYALILLVIIFPIGIVHHIKFLVPFSALANIFLLVGCALTVYICCIDLPPLSSRPMVVGISKWPLFFSTALFGMEGIGVIMPIENAMRQPSHLLGCPGVLNFAMTSIGLVNLVVGSVGYLKYGDTVQGSITLNLPEDTLSESVKIMVAMAILFTYPLQLTASMEVVWDGVKGRFSEKKQTSGYYLMRSLLIFGTIALAVAVPNLSPVISLVGAIGFSGLGLLLPTITELVTFWEHLSKPCGFTLLKAFILILIWALVTVAGTISSLKEIVQQYA